MRGVHENEGDSFAPAMPEKRFSTTAHAMPIFERVPEEYNSRNIRTLSGTVTKLKMADINVIPRKKTYEHIDRRNIGGWGHIPTTSRSMIASRKTNDQPIVKGEKA